MVQPVFCIVDTGSCLDYLDHLDHLDFIDYLDILQQRIGEENNALGNGLS